MKKILLIGLLLSVIVTYFTFYPLNEDTYWIMYSTGYMLDGGKLYIDIIETNPPLIFMISAIPVSIAELFSCSLSVSYIFFTIILSFLSSYLIYKILIYSKLFSQKVVNYITFGTLFILLIVPSGDFAQREHFMMIFVLPYIVMSMFRDRVIFSKGLLSIVSIFAIFGFNLKPYFYLLFIVIEIVIMLKNRKINLLNQLPLYIIASSGVIYLFIIYIFFPQYYSFGIPLALEAYTGVFNKTFVELLSKLDILFAFICIVYIFIFVKLAKKFDLFIIYISMIMLLIVYLLQQKGWHYQLLPFLMTTVFLMLYTMTVYIQKKDYKFIGIHIIILGTIIYYGMYYNRFLKLNTFLSTLDKHVHVVVYSTEMAMGLPLVVQNSQKWGSRFLSLWMLPKILSEKKESDLKKYFIKAIRDDLNYFQPRYIIFPTYYDKGPYYNYLVENSQDIDKVFHTRYYEMENQYFKVLKRIDEKNN